MEEMFFSLTFIHSLNDAVGRGEGCTCGRHPFGFLMGFSLTASQTNFREAVPSAHGRFRRWRLHPSGVACSAAIENCQWPSIVSV